MKRKFYWGYVATLLACMTIFGSAGILSSTMGNFIEVGIVEKGWDPLVVSIAYSLRIVPVAISPIVGFVLGKYGARRVIFWTTMITAAIVVISGYFESEWGFVLGFGLAVGISMYFNDNLACVTVINNWWKTKRGQMTGFLMTASSLGCIVFPLIIAKSLKTFGWSETMWICGILLVVITALPQFIWMKDRPEEVGQTLEEGIEHVDKKRGFLSRRKNSENTEVDWNTKEALKTPQIWVIGFLYGSACVPYMLVANYSITLNVMKGMDSVTATLFVSVIYAATLVVTLIEGFIIDRIGSKLSYILMFILGGIGLLSVLQMTTNYVTWILPLVCCAFPMAMSMPVSTTAVTKYYGVKNFSQIWSFGLPIATVMSVVLSPLVGASMNHFGTLKYAFVFGGIFMFICVLISLFLRGPKGKLEN